MYFLFDLVKTSMYCKFSCLSARGCQEFKFFCSMGRTMVVAM